VGANFVAKSESDGYSLLLMASGHSTSPRLYKSLAYDAVEDFTMVTMLASPARACPVQGSSFHFG
jgi:tripartite-type tricarboxylate transporter receptor subunit TctC